MDTVGFFGGLAVAQLIVVAICAKIQKNASVDNWLKLIINAALIVLVPIAYTWLARS